MADKMKVVLVRPGVPAEITEIEHTLEVMQKLVGGYIEAYEPFEDDAVIVCNEEGKVLADPVMNRAIVGPDGKLIDIICGTFFICYAPPMSEDFLSLPDEMAEKYAEVFKVPDIFVRKNGVIHFSKGTVLK